MTPFRRGFLRGLNMANWTTTQLASYMLMALAFAVILREDTVTSTILLLHLALPAWVFYGRLRDEERKS